MECWSHEKISTPTLRHSFTPNAFFLINSEQIILFNAQTNLLIMLVTFAHQHKPNRPRCCGRKLIHLPAPALSTDSSDLHL